MAKKTQDSIFVNGTSYTGVYFLKVDASGHSNIVVTNTADKVDKLFDLLEESVYAAIEDNKTINSCKYAEFWGWQGDGGLCVIYDEEETKALATTLDSAFSVLDYKLQELRNHLKKLKINGELNIRIAIHKGSYTYKGDSRRGSIHSKELNFVCHLEARTPTNSITISEDIYSVCDDETKHKFTPLDFQFEGKKIFVHNKSISNITHFEWLTRIDFHDSFKLNSFPERTSELEKATFIKHANTEVIDLGTAARTCSYYLASTQRPAHYKDTVLKLLERGVNYKCLILDPESDITRLYSDIRNEDLAEKIHGSIDLFAEFAREARGARGEFKVYLYSQLPYFACIAIDRNEGGSFLFSPYMPYTQYVQIERADTMHFLLLAKQNERAFSQLNRSVENLFNDPNTVLIQLS